MTDYFEALERELRAAAERQTQPSPRRPRLPRTAAARALLAAALALILGGVPAAAVTGVFSPEEEPDGLIRLSEPETVASGTLRDGRRWELRVSDSRSGACLGLRVPEAVGGEPIVSEGCGGRPPGTLSVATVSGGSRPRDGLAFGAADDRTTSVRVTARGVTLTVPTLDDPGGLPGRFYLAELPVREALGRTEVEALDGAGGVIATVSLG